MEVTALDKRELPGITDIEYGGQFQKWERVEPKRLEESTPLLNWFKAG